MELWIRSQDKTRLIKVNNVQYTYIKGDLYSDVRGKHYIGTYYDNLEILGEYATKERAIEVLDEIEKLIKPITIFQNCQVDKSTIEKIKEIGYCMVNNDARVEQISQAFYQMPED